MLLIPFERQRMPNQNSLACIGRSRHDISCGRGRGRSPPAGEAGGLRALELLEEELWQWRQVLTALDAPLRQEKRAAFARQTAGQRARAEEARAAWDKERAALEAEAAALQVKERARR